MRTTRWTTRIAFGGELCDFSTPHARLPMHRTPIKRHRARRALRAADRAAAAGRRHHAQAAALAAVAARRGATSPRRYSSKPTRFEGTREKETEAEGNVQLRRPGQLVLADWLRYDAGTQRGRRDGQRAARVPAATCSKAISLQLNLGTERGFMDKPTLRVHARPARPRPTPGQPRGSSRLPAALPTPACPTASARRPGRAARLARRRRAAALRRARSLSRSSRRATRRAARATTTGSSARASSTSTRTATSASRAARASSSSIRRSSTRRTSRFRCSSSANRAC